MLLQFLRCDQLGQISQFEAVIGMGVKSTVSSLESLGSFGSLGSMGLLKPILQVKLPGMQPIQRKYVHVNKPIDCDGCPSRLCRIVTLSVLCLMR